MSRPGDHSPRIVAEALRKARATWECVDGLCQWSWKYCDNNGKIQFEHRDAASWLLDGFSIAEITAAERTS